MSNTVKAQLESKKDEKNDYINEDGIRHLFFGRVSPESNCWKLWSLKNTLGIIKDWKIWVKFAVWVLCHDNTKEKFPEVYLENINPATLNSYTQVKKT